MSMVIDKRGYIDWSYSDDKIIRLIGFIGHGSQLFWIDYVSATSETIHLFRDGELIIMDEVEK